MFPVFVHFSIYRWGTKISFSVSNPSDEALWTRRSLVAGSSSGVLARIHSYDLSGPQSSEYW